MTTDNQYVQRPEYIDYRQFKDGSYIATKRKLFHYTLIYGADAKVWDFGFDDCWCYATYELAKQAFDSYQPGTEPEGWHRHPMSGRRRPEGDKDREYVNP